MSSAYQWLKVIHVSCVLLSFSGFFLRGLWMLMESSLLSQRWVKILPHIIDTTLLGSALLMLYVSRMSLSQNPWLMAKIIALIIYILLGMLALKKGRTKRVRGLAWGLGLLVFAYIVSVALSKSVAGFLSWL